MTLNVLFFIFACKKYSFSLEGLCENSYLVIGVAQILSVKVTHWNDKEKQCIASNYYY
jgi:hypothetical protein